MAGPPTPGGKLDKQVVGSLARSLVVVSIDGLRRDALEQAPRIAAWARGGTVFERARSPADYAKPSVAELLTGVSARRLEIQARDRVLVDEAWTVAEILRCDNVATASFGSNGWISEQFGFAQGWQHRRNYLEEGRNADAAEVLASARTWLDCHEGPTLLHVHLVDVLRRERTSAYDTPLTRREYDRALASIDATLGPFLDALPEDAFVTLVSTSAETLGDEPDPGCFQVPTSQRVLMVMRGPGVPRGQREPRVAELRDVVPTALRSMRLAIPSRVEGHAFAFKDEPIRRLRARERYPARDRILSRERCLQILGLGYLTGGECQDLPSEEEVARFVVPGMPTEPCGDVAGSATRMASTASDARPWWTQ